MELIKFTKEYAGDILRMFDKPAWEPELNDQNNWIVNTICNFDKNFKKKSRKPFPGQLEYVIAPQFNLLTEMGSKVGIIAAKMGTGKTTMSNTLAMLLFHHEYLEKGMKVMFLTAGSKHLNKMKREAVAVLGEVAEFFIIKLKPRRSKGEITPEEAALMKRRPGKILYFILSKDTGKATYKIKVMKAGQKCPKCGSRLGGKEKIGKRDIFECSKCNEKTWQAIGGTPSIGEVYRKIAGPKVNKLFDFMIVDEVHEMQNPNSLQSIMYKSLIRVTYRTLVMTGTLSNGYASSIFHILYPLIAQHFKKYGGFDYNKIGQFVDFFGSKKETSIVKLDQKGSRRRTVRIEELPQINDRIVSFLAPFTTWFSIEDLNVNMPEFHEHIHIVDQDPQIISRMKEWSDRVYAAASLVKSYNPMHFNASLHYKINNPTHNYVQTVKGEALVGEYDPNDLQGLGIPEEVSYDIPFEPLPLEFRSAKEKKLLELLKKESLTGRRTMVYCVYNQSTNIYSRLMQIISEEGLDVGYMPDNIKSEDIEQWIIDFEGDILLVPQKRVATGLDLVMFQTVIFFELDNQLRIVQQAKVRPWRPVGQDQEVNCHYIAFSGQQAKNLKQMAQKMRAAATVEGEIIDNDSIAAIYDYNPELTAAIAEIAADIQSGEIESDMLQGRELSEFENFYRECLRLNEVEESKEILIENDFVDNEVVDNEVVDNEVVDNEVVDNEVVDNEVIDNKVVNNEVVPEPLAAVSFETVAEVLEPFPIKFLENGQGKFVF